MEKLFLLALISLLLSSGSIGVAQYNPSKSYNFHPPLKIPLVLAANFGELRSNHFHTGIDFKTNRKIGYNIYSIDDGYVSRVKVSPYGYGLVVYVDHYNGLTSVYAHCSEFQGGLADLVKTLQEKKQNYEIEYYPPKDSLKVKRGEVIALSGNTGGSTAPHVHFEIRDTKTENALNPLLFNFEIPDKRKPTIRGVKVYALTDEGYRIPNKSKVLTTFGSNGSYSVSGNTLTIPANYTSPNGGIGFAFDAIDQLDAADNICGIFKVFLIVAGDTVYGQDMTEISFETNRQINSHKDYEDFHMRRKHFQKTFKTPHNPLPIYRNLKNNGVLKLLPGTTYPVNYICEDVYGNRSTLNFDLVIESGIPGEASDYYTGKSEYLYPDSAFMKANDDFYILFPPGMIYEPTPLKLKFTNELVFGSSAIPVQDYFKVMLPIKNKIAPDEKYLVIRKKDNGSSQAIKGNVDGDWISIKVRDFGRFSVGLDTIPPRVVSKNFVNGANVRGKELSFNLSDDLSGVVDYDLYIDDVWHVLEHEPKSKKYFFKPNLTLNGKKKVVLRLEDACGNVFEEQYELVF
jgi:hypothetical protein